MISFQIAPHGVLAGVETVEILVDCQLVGIIYPEGDDQIKLVSAHRTGVSVDEGFAGEVVDDQGLTGWPPVPALHVSFRPSPYRIDGDQLIKIPEIH